MTPKNALRALAADARQGVVGGAAYALAAILVLALLGVIGGTVPVWTLGALAVLLVVPAAIVLAAQARRLDQRAGELREARRQAAEARTAEAYYRQQLDLQAQGRTLLSPPAQAFVRRIMALRNDVSGDGRTWASDFQLELLRGIVSDMRDAIGSTRALSTLECFGLASTLASVDVIAALNQLEAIASDWGMAEALKPDTTE